VDFIKAYTFIPSEEGWITKILIGAVIMFFSWLFIPIFFLSGYQIAIARNVRDGYKDVLPDWGDDIGKLFIEGAVLWVAQFIYSLPIVLLIICGSLLILPTAASAEYDLSVLGAGTLIGSFALMCVSLLYGILLAVILPAVMVQFVRYGEFGAMFRFREVLGVARSNFVDILLVVLSAIAAGIVFSLVNIIPICGQLISVFVVPPWLQMSFGHLLGQLSAKIDGKDTEFAYAA